MDVSHNTDRANPEVISFENDKDIKNFSISHYPVIMQCQERSNTWKVGKR